MLEFMDYVQHGFYKATKWDDHNNQYSKLTATADGIIDFHTPERLRFNVSSLSSANFATSYTLSSRGIVDGSLSYLYSSLPLNVVSGSNEVPLQRLVKGYRQLEQLKSTKNVSWRELWQRGNKDERKDTLLYGRLYLPTSTLEGLYLRRPSPTRLFRLSCVSDSSLPNGGTVLAVLQNDYGKYSTDYLCSTDSALLGIRGLYNFGYDPRTQPGSVAPGSEASSASSGNLQQDPQHGRLSAGAEAYFSPLNKSGGVSTGVRFTTLPLHTGFPYTMTFTLNPLMGNVSSSYAVKAGRDLTLCSRFNFNFYSYESDVQVGMELWRRRETDASTAWAKKLLRKEWLTTAELTRRKEDDVTAATSDEDLQGVLKARVDQNWKIGILWEGRVQALLVSIGADLDLKKRDRILGSVGLEVSYSS